MGGPFLVYLACYVDQETEGLATCDCRLRLRTRLAAITLDGNQLLQLARLCESAFATVEL